MKIIFVDWMPNKRKENIIYISNRGRLIIHNCFCGCGEGVPITIGKIGKHNNWTYSLNDKKEITIFPSIATGLKCGSHYFIRDNKVVWSNPISREEVQKRLKSCI